MSDEYYIKIDCPPGLKRPDNIFIKILEKTTLNIDDFINITKPFAFGEWTFKLKNDDKINDFLSNIKIFQKELTTLYLQGAIRYAEWSPVDS
jgi:hypothetical protein